GRRAAWPARGEQGRPVRRRAGRPGWRGGPGSSSGRSRSGSTAPRPRGGRQIAWKALLARKWIGVWTDILYRAGRRRKSLDLEKSRLSRVVRPRPWTILDAVS